MLFRQMLQSSAARLRAPEDDTGSDYDDQIDDTIDDADEEPEDQDDELPEDDVDQTDDLDQGDPPQRQPSRAESRVREATRVAAEARTRTEALERELAAIRSMQSAPPRETQQQFNERLAQMEPWERTEYLRQQDRSEVQAALQRIEFNAQDSADKTAYEAMASRTPIAAKLKDEVETRLADMRKNNLTAPRETILKYLIGERALNNKASATTRATKAAAGRRDQNTSRPSNGRGDAVETGRRGNDAAARAKRLDNVNI